MTLARHLVLSLAAAAAMASGATALAQNSGAPAPAAPTAADFASDNDRFDGDRFSLRTRVDGFKEGAFSGGGGAIFCAPAGASMQVVREVGAELRVRFLEVPGDAVAAPAASASSGTVFDTRGRCPDASKVVSTNVAYTIAKARIRDDAAFRRTGFSFGALIVPFKYRTGEKEIVASSTIAPYVGWRLGFGSSLGITITPVFSAGLGLVPVSDPAGGSDTRTAFTLATGFVMGSSKNEDFQAGILIGRDFLGRNDRARDPGSKNVWVSFYVGFALSGR